MTPKNAGVLGIRFCIVSDKAESLAKALGPNGLGLRPSDQTPGGEDNFSGRVFPVDGDGGRSWIEMWPVSDGMPEGIMLQIEVDDADRFAKQAQENGVSMQGPFDAHGEHGYFMAGLPVSISVQSRVKSDL